MPVFVTVTWAPATTAPLGSVTRPLIAPRVSWAHPAAASRKAIARSEKMRRCILYSLNLFSFRLLRSEPRFPHYGEWAFLHSRDSHLTVPFRNTKRRGSY